MQVYQLRALDVGSGLLACGFAKWDELFRACTLVVVDVQCGGDLDSCEQRHDLQGEGRRGESEDVDAYDVDVCEMLCKDISCGIRSGGVGNDVMSECVSTNQSVIHDVVCLPKIQLDDGDVVFFPRVFEAQYQRG